jgi:hypothetical protein
LVLPVYLPPLISKTDLDFTQASLTRTYPPKREQGEQRWEQRGGEVNAGTHTQRARLAAAARLAGALALVGVAGVGLFDIAVRVGAVHAVPAELLALPAACARQARLAHLQAVRPAPALPPSSSLVGSALVGWIRVGVTRRLEVSSALVPLAASRWGYSRARGAGGVEQALI